jgi:NAD(P)-dependent dehydrogenase (short-subunit alcohol dehydrogenase family)
MNKIDGKVIVVTGAGRGLGEAIAREMAAGHAKVVLVDVRHELVNKLAEDLQEMGEEALALSVDLCDENAIKAAFDQIVEHFGRIDVLINNAGTDQTVSIEEMSIEDWDRVMAVNLRAPFVTSKLALPIMRENGSGHIVNIASTAAKRAWANASVYHASKWGLMGLTYALHVEARPNKIKVTAVVAGGMKTPFLLDRFPDIDTNNLQDPKNVAETIHYILTQPEETVIPEVMVLPMRETSWP